MIVADNEKGVEMKINLRIAKALDIGFGDPILTFIIIWRKRD